jgi:hypothetical protein
MSSANPSAIASSSSANPNAAPKLYLPRNMAGGLPARYEKQLVEARRLDQKRRATPQFRKPWQFKGQNAGLREHPGRKFGATAASWISDLSELRKTIILCWSCQSKFYHSRHNYYKDRKFAFVMGDCDGCRDFAHQGAVYIHESLLAEYGGKTRAGQVWTPK